MSEVAIEGGEKGVSETWTGGTHHNGKPGQGPKEDREEGVGERGEKNRGKEEAGPATMTSRAFLVGAL